MKNLSKSFEVDNAIKAGGVILPQSIVDLVRSSKSTFTGDFITRIEFYNALTQVNADRIAQSDFTYTNDFITSQVNTYFESDGVTVHQTESMAYIYSGDNLLRVEVT